LSELHIESDSVALCYRLLEVLLNEAVNLNGAILICC